MSKTDLKNVGKIIYFADPSDEIEEEAECIKKQLKQNNITWSKFEVADVPTFYDEIYDVLFFDWGGMSMGNSMLERFCKDIIKIAGDYPNRLYIMTSFFTKEAMKEALEEIDIKNTSNVFLTIHQALPYLLAE